MNAIMKLIGNYEIRKEFVQRSDDFVVFNPFVREGFQELFLVCNSVASRGNSQNLILNVVQETVVKLLAHELDVGIAHKLVNRVTPREIIFPGTRRSAVLDDERVHHHPLLGVYGKFLVLNRCRRFK